MLKDVVSDFCRSLAEGEGLYNCDDETIAALGYQWKFEFNLDHAETVIGTVKTALYEVNITAFGNPVGGAKKAGVTVRTIGSRERTTGALKK